MLDLQRFEAEADISAALGIYVDQYRALQTDTGKEELVDELHREKRNGGVRKVYRVESPLLTVLKNLATAATAAYRRPSHVYGCVPGGSVRKNALPHLGARRVAVADIRAFFGSISVAQVADAWVSLGVPTNEGARSLAMLCTLNGALPEGFNTSPILANAAAGGLDVALDDLAGMYGCKLTRYVDDIAFSGEVVPTHDEVSRTLNRHGFDLRQGSYRVMPRGASQVVCGVCVADPNGPRAPRELKRRLKYALLLVDNLGLEVAAARWGRSPKGLFDDLAGKLGWVRGIERGFTHSGVRRLYDDYHSLALE